tara:strand:+ start:542 stop:802 length:261 start_codon:yes stop_codon:yes gene_type:complete
METFIIAVAVLAMILLVCLVISALLRWLWNMTVPQVFGLKEITYWQAFRILIIAGILFGTPPNDELRKIKEGINDINDKLEIFIEE